MVNGPLLKRVMESLEPRGIRVLRNNKFPPLDGGYLLGKLTMACFHLFFLKQADRA
jgi:hydrogenase maturation factor HypF (carbamoyltransferase family)